ncbi:hypothetical protein [Dyella sp.]|uniref:hypothetical protein n=1 Tax=Dyella sp. TaxID=1869338 RepID=UPI002ED1516F
MIDPTTAQQLQELSVRIARLEGENHPTWAPIIVSLAIGVASAAISIWSQVNARRQSRASALETIKSNVDAAKAQVETASMQLAPLVAKLNPTADEVAELTLKRQAFESIIERLLNAYEDGCRKYFNKQVDPTDFVQTYHQDIATYIEANKEKFAPPLTRFTSMVRYYDKEHKRVSS